MKKSISHKLGLVAAAIGFFFLPSCVTSVLTGQTIKETRDVSSFSGVSLAFSGNIYITQGSPQKVVIEADKSDMEVIESEINGNTLVLKTKDRVWRNLGKINVYITMPDIDHLTISGSGDLICENSVKTDEIELVVSGSGTMKLNKLEAREISANITGSGDIMISGSSNNDGELDATITGSGSFKAEGIAVSEASVRITGSGSATVNVVKELETNITGSGSVHYKGNPLINANATGSGKTRSIN